MVVRYYKRYLILGIKYLRNYLVLVIKR